MDVIVKQLVDVGVVEKTLADLRMTEEEKRNDFGDHGEEVLDDTVLLTKSVFSEMKQGYERMLQSNRVLLLGTGSSIGLSRPPFDSLASYPFSTRVTHRQPQVFQRGWSVRCSDGVFALFSSRLVHHHQRQGREGGGAHGEEGLRRACERAPGQAGLVLCAGGILLLGRHEQQLDSCAV